MELRCHKCGYEGSGFVPIHITPSEPCCGACYAGGWELYKCPECGKLEWYNMIAEREKKGKRIRELFQLIKEEYALGNKEQAYRLYEEIEGKDILLNEEEEEFLRQIRREIRSQRKTSSWLEAFK